MSNVTDKNGKIKINKTLDYGYAHTIHKSQGGTYTKVMILEPSISDTPFDNQLKNQLKYVAMSRATDHVYVFTNKNLNKAAAQAKPAQPEPSMPTPTQPTTQSTEVKPTEGREPVRKSGTMYFSYNGLQRPEVLARTTFDAIIAGQRTATTRFPEDANADYWFDTEEGDIITWWSGNKVGEGRSVTVQVTSVVPVDFTQMSDQELENWSKLEGWSLGYAKNKRTANIRNKGIQIRYRILPGDQAKTLTGPKTDDLDNSDKLDNNCTTPFLD
jgi:hypothetical protein